ncbi:MAG: SHOCT domain-containing protein [Planctomycetota bacterium]|nr:MAG: SHOCT domain-containing protein [Planctomycetota bacterium]
MWKRIRRAVNANLGRLRGDPLAPRAPGRKDLRELGDRLKVVREQVVLLERDLRSLRDEEASLSSAIRAALDAGHRPRALERAEQLARVRQDAARVEAQLARARAVCRRAEGLYAAGGTPLTNGAGGAPAARAPELEAAAEATLRRLERELRGEEPDEPELAADDGVAARKTIGDDPAEAPASSSQDPVPPGADDGVAARKTIGETEAPPPDREAHPDGARAAEAGDALVAELERLASLRERGLLSVDEYEAAKRKLLG